MKIIFISMVGLFIISLAPFLPWTVFQQIDIEMLKFINLNRAKGLDTFFIGITNSVTYVCIATLLLLITVKSWRKHLPYFIASFLVAAITSTILKFSIHRVRPFITYHFIEKLSSGGSPSFPSGHTTDAFMIAVAVGLISRRWYLMVWALLVAYSRMRLGVHYPSDVLAGIATGSMAAILCYREKLLCLFLHPPSQQAG
jgi:undecaprenyl-diphosphatase